MSDPHELEQANLHFHDSVVKTNMNEAGFALIYTLNNYEDEPDDALWSVSHPLVDKNIWSDDKIPYDEFKFEPFFPTVGYYNIPNIGCVYYTRSARKQWQESYSTSSRHSIIRKVISPLSNVSDPKVDGVSAIDIIDNLFFPFYPTIDTVMDALLNYEGDEVSDYCVALSTELCGNLVYPGKPPILMHHEQPIGYIDDNGVAILPPVLSELEQVVAERMEVKVA